MKRYSMEPVISSIFDLNGENLIGPVQDLPKAKTNPFSLLWSIEQSGATENLNLTHTKAKVNLLSNNDLDQLSIFTSTKHYLT